MDTLLEPLVAIILVNYNGFSDTVECIESIKSISYKNKKIIVVDNASSIVPSDSELKYISENADYVVAEYNDGFSSGNNIGIEYARRYDPHYYLLLNNDTVVTKEFLTVLVESAIRNVNVGIVTGRINYYTSAGNAWFCGGELDLSTGLCRHFLESQEAKTESEISFATGCLMLIPSRVIHDIGLLDTQYFLYCEDTEYSARVLLRGYKIIYNPEALIYHKVSASTGGKSSHTTQYYYVRNSLLNIQKYASNKMIGFLKFSFNRFKDIVRSRFQLRWVAKGYKDFFLKRFGKQQIQ